MATASGIPGIMAGTKPWVRLVSILGFISAGFTVVAGIGTAVFGLSLSGSPSSASLRPF